MASTNLTYSGATGVLNAKAEVTEVTTTGMTRQVRLRLCVYAVDYGEGRNGSYSVKCSNAGVDMSTACVITGSELDIFDKTFTVYLTSDFTTAIIDLSFKAQVYSASAGGYRTIEGTITRLTLTEYIPEYTLSVSTGIGSSILVERSSSNYASTGTLTDGDSIYDGDVLQVSFSALTGYKLKTQTVNGSAFTSGESFTVSGAVTIASVAEVLSYILSINAGTGSTVTVNRTSSPKQGASTGELSNGATIYYSDALKITFATGAGYEITEHTVNGVVFASGGTHTVTGAVSVVVAVMLLGLVYIDSGTAYDRYLVYIDNGTGWDMYAPYIDNGTSWDLYS